MSRAIKSFSFNSPAPKIIGIDNKNEKRAAASRVSPVNNAAVMVIPERDVPGINAIAWAKPIINMSLKLSSYSSLTFLPLISDHHSKAPNTIVVEAIIIGFLSASSNPSFKNKPKATAGRVAIITHQAKRLFEVGWRVTKETDQSRPISQTSFLK